MRNELDNSINYVMAAELKDTDFKAAHYKVFLCLAFFFIVPLKNTQQATEKKVPEKSI